VREQDGVIVLATAIVATAAVVIARHDLDRIARDDATTPFELIAQMAPDELGWG
jgi:hypothetical protein